MLDQIANRFQEIVPPLDFWSLRLMDLRAQSLMVRQNVLQPIENTHSRGALVFVQEGGGSGYGATCDLTASGLARAVADAREMAEINVLSGLISPDHHARARQPGRYQSPVKLPWIEDSLEDKIAFLHDLNRTLRADDAIVDWVASMEFEATEVVIRNSDGVEIEQSFSYVSPGLAAVANRGAETQRRTFGFNRGQQGGMERILQWDLPAEASRLAEQALTLLDARNCPSGNSTVLLMPDQMTLQIHESIGHPLELDRILGDERNYAGTSFVTPQMFGTYQYGSELLNVTFDPSLTEELASYRFDDEGTPAERQYLIREGRLLRPLGGRTSQLRAGLAGVANARACDWNRPAIDRMANLNLEPGDSTLHDMIGRIERGIMMETNRSWSIDDSRNKFQFGCEYGRLIVDGELREAVKNPNYRGISSGFWRNLADVGDRDTFEIMGVPSCGKGEPNQMIRVGHASPACVFKEVEVFGGD